MKTRRRIILPPYRPQSITSRWCGWVWAALCLPACWGCTRPLPWWWSWTPQSPWPRSSRPSQEPLRAWQNNTSHLTTRPQSTYWCPSMILVRGWSLLFPLLIWILPSLLHFCDPLLSCSRQFWAKYLAMVEVSLTLFNIDSECFFQASFIFFLCTSTNP